MTTEIEGKIERPAAVAPSRGMDAAALGIGAVLLMFKSQKILWVRFLPDTPIYLLAFFFIAVYVAFNWRKLEEITLFKGVMIMLLACIFGYDNLIVSESSLQAGVCMFITIVGAAVIVQAPLADKKTVLRYFTIAVEVSLAVSLIAWIFFLVGYQMPHFQDNSETYYRHQVYYFFNTYTMNSPADIYRFAGPFLEPGHLGSMCVYLLYINKFNLKKIGNIILVVSTFMSLSLAAYGLMVGAVLILLVEQRRYVIMGIMAGIFLLIGVGAAAYLNGDNVLNKAIVSRLEVTEDGEIAGNNRYTTFFKDTFDKYLKSDHIWLGEGRDAMASKNKSAGNLMMGNAGYKRYFYLRGVVGSALIVIFLLAYFWHYRSFKSMGYFIIYIVSNMIRDYPTKEIWMYLYLLAIPILYYEGRTLRRSRKHRTNPEMPDEALTIPQTE